MDYPSGFDTCLLTVVANKIRALYNSSQTKPRKIRKKQQMRFAVENDSLDLGDDESVEACDLDETRSPRDDFDDFEDSVDSEEFHPRTRMSYDMCCLGRCMHAFRQLFLFKRA